MEKQGKQDITSLVLKAVALGMGVVCLVLGFIPGVADVDTQITLLSIGLTALALQSLSAER